MSDKTNASHHDKSILPDESSLQNFCRICAEKSSDLQPVFGPLDLAKKINLCLPITVVENDSLPLHVCRSCAFRLDLSYQLATLSQQAEVKLKNLLDVQLQFEKYVSILDSADCSNEQQPQREEEQFQDSPDFVQEQSCAEQSPEIVHEDNTPEFTVIVIPDTNQETHDFRQQIPKTQEEIIDMSPGFKVREIPDLNQVTSDFSQEISKTQEENIDITPGFKIIESPDHVSILNNPDFKSGENSGFRKISSPEYECIGSPEIIKVEMSESILEFNDQSNTDTAEENSGSETELTASGTFSCEYCKEIFEKRRNMTQHIGDSHTFWCRICETNIHGADKTILKKHNNKKHPRQTNSKQIKTTSKTASVIVPIVQSSTAFIAPKPVSIEQHNSRFLPIQPKPSNYSSSGFQFLTVFPKNKCEKCLCRFKNQTVLNKHICVPHFVCQTCKVRFLDVKKFNTHNCVRKLFCEICFVTFKTYPKLRSHNCKSNIKCDKCHNSLKNHFKLKSHKCNDKMVKRKTPKMIQNVCCKNCSKIFSKLDKLIEHLDVCVNTCKKCFHLNTEEHNCVRMSKRNYLKIIKTESLNLKNVCNNIESNSEIMETSNENCEINSETRNDELNESEILEDFEMMEKYDKNIEENGENSNTENHNFSYITCDKCYRHFPMDDNFKNHNCNPNGDIFEPEKEILCPSLITQTVIPIKFICRICNSIHIKKDKLRIHLKTEHSIIICQNTNCFEYFDNIKEMNSHNSKIHQRKVNTRLCELCGKACTSTVYYRMHMHYEHNNGATLYNCDFCGKGYRMKQKLVNHIVSHIYNEKNVPCDLCNEKFISHYYLKTHKLTAHKEKRFECPECKNKYTFKNQLTRHLKNVHVNYLMFKCSICNEPFKSSRDAVRHFCQTHEYREKIQMINMYYKDSPFHCDICSRYFRNEEYLIIHKKKHEKGVVFHPKGFNTNTETVSRNICGTDVVKEKKKKTSDEIHTCSICSKICINSAGLKHHMGVHLEDKKLECTVCGKAFATTLQVAAHERYHNMDRIYECEFCLLQFKNKKNISRHMKYMH